MHVSTNTVVALLGRQKMADALGVTTSTINAANAKGKFPAAWAVQVRRLLAKDGRDPEHEAPDSLFNFK